MLFQVRTDNHITNNQALAERLETEVAGALTPQYGEQVRRVEVYLQDMNGHKKGIDTRCAIEVHLAGYPPVAVTADADNVEDAVSGAVEHLLRTLEHKLGRLRDHKGRVSMSGEET